MTEADKDTIIDLIHEMIKGTNDSQKIEAYLSLYRETIDTWLTTNPPVQN